MSGLKFIKKESTLGKAKDRRFFDLGLHKSTGTGFLEMLTGLMTFLAILAIATSFALAAMADRWSAGLDDQITIEIPASLDDKTVLKQNELEDLSAQVAKTLSKIEGVENIEIKSRDAIEELVRPWLGEDPDLRDIPLPALITLSLDNSDRATIPTIKRKVEAVSPHIRIDTHEDWIRDLLGFTSALQFSIFVIGTVIGLTTIIAVSGGVRSKLSIHHDEVELLHLMGAYDSYIARQFQIYAFFLALKGSVIGAFIAGLALMIISFSSQDINVSLLPNFKLETAHIIILAFVPFIIALLATFTARHTVSKSLLKMM